MKATELFDRVVESATSNDGSIAILGRSSTAFALESELKRTALSSRVVGLFDPAPTEGVVHLDSLIAAELAVLVVADDERKEELLRSYEKSHGVPVRTILVGIAHQEYHDPILNAAAASSPLVSIANGYPESTVHLAQAVRSLAARSPGTTLVEFGTYRGGTAFLLGHMRQALEMPCRVLTFDTFDGFPPPRSSLDIYRSSGSEFRNLEAVRRVLSTVDVQVVPGDIYETCERLRDEQIGLAFFDTDNYSATKQALEVCKSRLVVGGFLAFDHYVTTERFNRTIGERLAAQELLCGDPDYFNAHGTGLFIKMR